MLEKPISLGSKEQRKPQFFQRFRDTRRKRLVIYCFRAVWSKKLEVENQLIRRLSNKLLFRHEKSRAEPEASSSLTLGGKN